ncbi:MAG TPA: histidine kinase dimerization/phospho-acceptor domain-containing protein [Anaeromyxobacter sp.]|nr:histidine kinase dimerization/phospho-acceptor domain-containing protein [Anaeromyxobacter sp.]
MPEEVRNHSEDTTGRAAEPAAELEDARRHLAALHEASRAFAHDFKNPLSALLLGVQRLARFVSPEHQPRARALATRLEYTVQTMNRLVEGLADLARYQAGKLELEPARHTVAEILARAAEPLRAGAADRRQQLELATAADLPEVDWDAERVARALQHLVARALHLAPEGAGIRCSAAPSAGQVVVTVEGVPGPPPAAEPPAGGPASRGSRSLDLELLFARALVEAHGGTLAAEERAAGPVFRVVLPTSCAAA